MKNLFEMGANFEEGWSSDNKEKIEKKSSHAIKEPCKHQLYFTKEKRRGKVVTTVKPFYLKKNDLQALLKTLKKKLGTGGTAKDECLEFQGDISPQLRSHLTLLGYRFKN
ncbi:Translation initiation factor SUI1-related protein [hydrothermal vent metagenome]|uniref:Translation initiation factor SUI1-related protein n=1 Tax=hydrothermal vent metagenome TaxID=652676 RepID=A0A1W1CJP9_9ZZZZ